MADTTHSGQAIKNMKERMSQKMDPRFMELATYLQQKLQELITQKIGESNTSSFNDNVLKV